MNQNRPLRILIITGESSGDKLATELVTALKKEIPDGCSIECAGAGGKHLDKTGFITWVDLTKHAVVGLIEPLKKIFFFRKVLKDLVSRAISWKPDMVVLVDYSGFNLKFAKSYLSELDAPPYGSEPRPSMVYFISPQVWASRAGRARVLESHFDKLLSIFPFEKEWYKSAAPTLDVHYIGHPLVDRYPAFNREEIIQARSRNEKRIILLPGSRDGEIRKHWPVMESAINLFKNEDECIQFSLVLPNSELVDLVNQIGNKEILAEVEMTDDLAGTLQKSNLAIASSGTVTMECAWFRIPTIVIYKTSWITYQIAQRIITVDYLAMPNLLAGKLVFPEFIQNECKPELIFQAGNELLKNEEKYNAIVADLDSICQTLGESGPCIRAAKELNKMLS